VSSTAGSRGRGHGADAGDEEEVHDFGGLRVFEDGDGAAAEGEVFGVVDFNGAAIGEVMANGRKG
jgi:hypothetical protein